MPVLKAERKLVAFKRESQEEHPTNNLSRNTNVLRVNEDYITKISEDLDDRGSKNNVSEVSQDKVSNSRYSVETERVSSELTNSAAILNHSGDIPEL